MTVEVITNTPPRRATLTEWLALPEGTRSELIDGRIVRYAMPGSEHGATQAGIAAATRDRFHRSRGDAERPGGWWISLEVDMHIGGLGCRPDLVGWRRADHPRMPTSDARGLVTEVPAWICEVLSPSTARYDLGEKRIAYHAAGVPWYWVADPANRTLTVLKRTEEDYLVVAVAGAPGALVAEPFGGMSIDLNAVFDFGDDPL